jgi:hypothetical protein
MRASATCEPIAPNIAAMRRKDATLYAEIAGLPILEAMARWKEVYPGDFPH